MQRALRSLRYAWEGLSHAWIRERNLRLFTEIYCAVLACASLLPLARWEWVLLVGSGGAFVTIELLNTAIERLTDAFDRMPKMEGSGPFHAAMKATKDVGAAAALVSLATTTIAVLLVVGPHVVTALRR